MSDALFCFVVGFVVEKFGVRSGVSLVPGHILRACGVGATR